MGLVDNNGVSSAIATFTVVFTVNSAFKLPALRSLGHLPNTQPVIVVDT
ncbi:MAG: hypothetical protein WB696_10040 [Chthoniobacterales bacterium]|jgi:hypothetical protein